MVVTTFDPTQPAASRPTATPAQAALVIHLKQAIKAAAQSIRTHKAECRQRQHDGDPKAPWLQSQLATERAQTRARLLIYGLARGRAWTEIEPGHTTSSTALTYYLTRVWREVSAAVEAEVGAAPSAPDALATILPARRA